MAQAKATFVIKAVDKTKAAFQSVDKSVGKLAKSFAALGVAAGAAVAGALVKFTTDAAKSANEIGKFSKQLGISTQALSEYKFVAQQSGIEFNQFAIALQRLARRTGEASAGAGEAAQTLKDLGLNASQLVKLPLDEQFEKVVEALNKTKNANVQLAQTFKLVDSEGVKLLRVFRGGAEEIRELRGEARRLGISLDQAIVDKAEDTVDAFGRVGSAAEGVGVALLDIVSEPVIGGLDAITTSLVSIGNAFKVIDALGIPAALEMLITDPARLASGGRLVQKELEEIDIAIEKLQSRGRSIIEREQSALGGILGVTPESVDRELASIFVQLDELVARRDSIRDDQVAKDKAAITEVAAVDVTTPEVERRKPDIDLVPVPDFAIDAARQYAQVLEDIQTPFERYTDEVERLNALTDTTGITTEELNRALVQAGEGYRDAQLAAEGLSEALDANEFEEIANVAGSVARGITDAFISSNQSIADSFKQLAQRVISQLFEILVVQQLVDAATGAISGLGKKALGGPVEGGTPILVGERGPELFVPQGAGNVVPNNALGGSANITFNINTLDGRTAAAVIAENKDVIIGVVAQGFQRAGNSIGIA